MSARIRPIVVGIDRDCGSAVALSWAAREAALGFRPLRMLHAQPDPYGLMAGTAGLMPVTEWESPPDDAQDMLDAALDAVHGWEPWVHAVARVELGDPVRLLLDQARSAAMVVLGNHGGHLLGDLLTGTVCRTVAALAPCPVVTVNGQPAWPESPIVVGIGDPAAATEALEFAFDLAARRSVELRVHRIVRQRHRRRTRAATAALVAAVTPFAVRYPRVPVVACCSSGDPLTALTEAAAEAQLLVVGGRRHGSTTGLFGASVSQALLRKAPCPIAVVRQGCAVTVRS